MKKRILALLLAVCIAASMLVLPASAAATNNTAVQMAITLGAMDTDQTGALNAVVTRGAFARMLASFSTFRESVGAQGTVGTLDTDVPGTSPWAPYIRIAVQQGWLNGYTDGSYRPDNAVTLEEACTAVLKLMGYKMTELNGAFPNAQLNKASEIGLRTGLDRKQGEAMNYEDAAVLLYNALDGQHGFGRRLRHHSGLYRFQRPGGCLHCPAQQPAGPLYLRRGGTGALYPGSRLPQR